MIHTNILKHTATIAASLALALSLAAFSGLGTGVTPAEADQAPGLAQARSAHGLQGLYLDPTLQAVAQDQANYMAAAGNMSHTTAPGLDFGSRMMQSGFGRKASENIGRGRLSDRQIVTAWMNSTNHRNNMLKPELFALRICFRNRSFRQALLGDGDGHIA